MGVGWWPGGPGARGSSGARGHSAGVARRLCIPRRGGVRCLAGGSPRHPEGRWACAFDGAVCAAGPYPQSHDPGGAVRLLRGAGPCSGAHARGHLCRGWTPPRERCCVLAMSGPPGAGRWVVCRCRRRAGGDVPRWQVRRAGWRGLCGDGLKVTLQLDGHPGHGCQRSWVGYPCGCRRSVPCAGGTGVGECASRWREGVGGCGTDGGGEAEESERNEER